jgi:HK97 gp10 family phage protein
MIELDTKGFQEMIDTLDNMGKDGETIFKRALDEGIKIVQKAIQRRAPVYKGPAKSYIKSMKSIIPGLLKANILIGKVRKFANGVYSQVCGPTKGDIRQVYYGKFSEWGSSHEPAKPWMRPGFDESKDEAYGKVESVIMDGIDNTFKK